MKLGARELATERRQAKSLRKKGREKEKGES
jgi:hypothetical protein